MTLKNILESADNIKYEILLKGLTEKIVRQISTAQNEPDWMLKHRLQCFEIFKNSKFPKR